MTIRFSASSPYGRVCQMQKTSTHWVSKLVGGVSSLRLLLEPDIQLFGLQVTCRSAAGLNDALMHGVLNSARTLQVLLAEMHEREGRDGGGAKEALISLVRLVYTVYWQHCHDDTVNIKAQAAARQSMCL